ncbi:MAG: hypothetical protein HYV93_24345 [Candidatus Rokubacteria bacterium]|nr:hypothetical protein [Candidatus Rokubacteria bacterium]
MAPHITTPPFHDLEQQARRLQRFFVALVVIVALLPAVVFVFLEIGHHRNHSRQAAGRLAESLIGHVGRSGPNRVTISEMVQAEMGANDIVFLRLVAADAGHSLSFGAPGQRVFPTQISVSLPPAAAPFLELQVQGDDRDLLRRVSRVFVIHLLVASALALIVYRLPMRALRLALDEGKRTYEELLHADKLSAIGEVYAGLTHEINNPLGVILSRVRLLRGTAAERGLPADLAEDLEMIDRHGSRIAEIIRGLLAFARKTTFELTETDLNRVVADTISFLETPFAKQGVRLNILLESIPPLRASPDHLQQVLVNLFNNARDAMPNGGTLTIRTRLNDRDLVVEVQDTGPGIAPEIQGRIFDPFFTTKPVGHGTGMGLAVSYGIVRAHGGDIEVESSPGQGALFRVRLAAGGGRP